MYFHFSGKICYVTLLAEKHFWLNCMMRFKGASRVMRRDRQRGWIAGWGVGSGVQWTTRRRTRSRRMINNENTAKQTAERGRAETRRGSQSSDAARIRRVSGAGRDAFENRCTIGDRHSTLVIHRKFWSVLMTYVTAAPMRPRHLTVNAPRIPPWSIVYESCTRRIRKLKMWNSLNIFFCSTLIFQNS